MHNYIVVSLLTGARTEELRALRWEHVHIDRPATPAGTAAAYVEVWRSVRSGGDTKTRKSRRTLALAGLGGDALRRQRVEQAEEKLQAGDAVGRPGAGLPEAGWDRDGQGQCAPSVPGGAVAGPELGPRGVVSP